MAVPATETRPADVGLKREVGLIGAIWASEGSIIGSGWLFASLYATQVAGAAAIYAWLIGGVAWVIVAALATPATPIRVSAKRESRMNIVSSMVSLPLDAQSTPRSWHSRGIHLKPL